MEDLILCISQFMGFCTFQNGQTYLLLPLMKVTHMNAKKNPKKPHSFREQN